MGIERIFTKLIPALEKQGIKVITNRLGQGGVLNFTKKNGDVCRRIYSSEGTLLETFTKKKNGSSISTTFEHIGDTLKINSIKTGTSCADTVKKNIIIQPISIAGVEGKAATITTTDKLLAIGGLESRSVTVNKLIPSKPASLRPNNINRQTTNTIGKTAKDYERELLESQKNINKIKDLKHQALTEIEKPMAVGHNPINRANLFDDFNSFNNNIPTALEKNADDVSSWIWGIPGFLGLGGLGILGFNSLNKNKVDGYNVTKYPDGRYAVAVKNGNMGAKIMSEAEFRTFQKEQKTKNHKLGPCGLDHLPSWNPRA